jgi:flagellar basal-body rod protein FlgB
MADISPISFGQTTDLLGNAIAGADLENDQIANNIANVNTPNFRTSSTNFKDALAATLGTPAPEGVLPLKTNDSRQFALDNAMPPAPFAPQVIVNETTQMRADKSNVDIDQESAKLSENAEYEQTMSQLLSEQYKFLREAIQEQTN